MSDNKEYCHQFWNEVELAKDERGKFQILCKLWSTNTTICEINDDANLDFYSIENIIKNNKIYYENIPGFTWDNTISFFELLCWFNQHYNEFIKEARELPQLEATFRDMDTTKIVTRKFVFDHVPKDCLGLNPLMVFHEDYDKHKSWGNPTRRELVFGVGLSDKTQIVDNNDFAGRYSGSRLYTARYYECEIDHDIYNAYVDLRNKYYDFLRVYSILKNLNLDEVYATYIDSPNPFKKIRNFKLFLPLTTNESAYMCTYKLGSKYPIFCGNNIKYNREICDNIFKPYDYIPKMTRIRRDRFDVNIDLSDIEFPKLSEYDKQFVYVLKK